MEGLQRGMSTKKQAMIPSRDLESLRAGKCQDPRAAIPPCTSTPSQENRSLFTGEIEHDRCQIHEIQAQGERVNLVAENREQVQVYMMNCRTVSLLPSLGSQGAKRMAPF